MTTPDGSDVEANTSKSTGTVRFIGLRADGSAQDYSHRRSRETMESDQSGGYSKRGSQDQSPGALKPATEDGDGNVSEAGSATSLFRGRADPWLVTNLEAEVARLTGEIGRLSSELDNYAGLNELDNYAGLNRALTTSVAELNDQNMI
jgi:hypothetical protein